jgi:hypothetical protein
MARLGRNGKLYYNSGTYGSPTWVEITRARDVNINKSKAESDASSRATVFALSKGAQLILDISFDYQDSDAADTVHDALRASYNDSSAIEILVLNGSKDTAGSKGYRLSMEVMTYNEPQPLTGSQTSQFVLKPCPSSNPPAAYTAS